MSGIDDTVSDAAPFDADAFMNTTVDAPMATQLQSIPDCESVAVIGDFTSEALKTITYKDKKTGQDVSRRVLEVPFILQSDELKAKMQRDNVVHRESYWLDFDANGRLDTGPDKNVSLGKLRAVLGQNQPGVPWAPGMLRNCGPLLVSIKSKSANDPTDPDKKYTNIAKYAKIS